MTNQINEGQQPCNTIAGSKIATEAIIYVAVMKGKNIIKKNKFDDQGYNGLIPLVSGEIAEDFANYYYTSEQKNTAVALGVLVNKDGVKRAGGFIVSSMPDATEDELFILENRLKEAKPISQMLDENMTLLDIAKDITGDINIKVLDEEIHPKYECNCSKEKMEKALISIGKEELSNILEEDKKAEIVCHFCNKKYEFSEEDLKCIIRDVS